MDQKGAVRTKYGTRDELLSAAAEARQAGIQIYWDVVLNHRMGGDEEEEFPATPYNDENRREQIGESRNIRNHTHFTFPGRRKKYSGMEWLDHVRNYAKRKIFAVGEYWSYEIEALHHFITVTNGDVALFDAPLHRNFSDASKAGSSFDMSNIFENTLVRNEPALAVTLVANHDTQPLQALESVVEEWFKPLAYSLILLRREGYPCVFYADYYGASYEDVGRDGNTYAIEILCHRKTIDDLIRIRNSHAYGDQYDYFDHSNTVGWTRLGTEEHPGGLAVVLSNGEAGTKHMETSLKNHEFYDALGNRDEVIHTDDKGWAEFRCNAGSVSVWLPR